MTLDGLSPRLFLQPSSVDEGSVHQGGSRLCNTLITDCADIAGAFTALVPLQDVLTSAARWNSRNTCLQTHGGVARLSYGNAFSQKQRVCDGS